MFNPATYWHDPEVGASQTLRRLQMPLHYHLRRHDYIAFQKELKSGTNPLVRDECGRSPLDLALMMLEDLIITSLCTSFPVDFLVKTLDYEGRFPAKFCPHYANAYSNLYDHPNALRLAAERVQGNSDQRCPFGTGAPSEYPRFVPSPFPLYKHQFLSTRAYKQMAGSPIVDIQPKSHGQKESDEENDEESDESEELDESEEPEHHDQVPPILRPPNATKLQKLFQDQMVIVVEDAIRQPTPGGVKQRIQELLAQMRALTRVIEVLGTCEPLRVLAIEYRWAISRRGGPIDRQEPPSFVLENLTYPYLFMSTLQNLFEMYPFNPSETHWDIDDVSDSRRLINLVLFKNLKGHEVLHFLAQLPRFICSFIRAYGHQFFRPSPEIAQYLMNYAFCMDAPDLFYFACRSKQVFSCGDLFSWDKLITNLLPYKAHFCRFLIPLITTRLKNRVQRRLVATDDESESETRRRCKDDNIYLPFEERYLTKDFIEDFGELFGTADVEVLENMLRWWQLEVTRLKNGDSPTELPRACYATDRDVLRPPTFKKLSRKPV